MARMLAETKAHFMCQRRAAPGCAKALQSIRETRFHWESSANRRNSQKPRVDRKCAESCFVS
jgi:hypothetical protein